MDINAPHTLCPVTHIQVYSPEDTAGSEAQKPGLGLAVPLGKPVDTLVAKIHSWS